MMQHDLLCLLASVIKQAIKDAQQTADAVLWMQARSFLAEANMLHLIDQQAKLAERRGRPRKAAA